MKLLKECYSEGHSISGKPYDRDDLQKWLGQYDVGVCRASVIL